MTNIATDRRATLAGLAALGAAAWVYLVLGAGMTMETMDMGDAPPMVMMPEWNAGYLALVLAMWAAMMAAMMLPSAARAIVGAGGPGRRVAAAAAAAVGYLAVWILFAAAATVAQWSLASHDLLSETMALRSQSAGAMLLIAVGAYQLTPLKRGRLARCRTRAPCADPGESALRQGWRYGLACLACCAPLMALLFVGGVMNLVWIAAIALWVLIEKELPRGDRVAQLGGAGLIAAGCAWLVLGG